MIQEQLDHAKQCEAEGEEYKKQYANQLKEIKNEANTILEKARNDAKAEGSMIVEKAQNDARLTLEKAQRDIESEKIDVTLPAIVGFAATAANLLLAEPRMLDPKSRAD